MDSPEWPENAQRLIVLPVGAADDAIRARFSHPHVVEVNSFEKCGCAFGAAGAGSSGRSDAELEASRESNAALEQYVRDEGVEELYACWSGDEALPVESRREVRVSELGRLDERIPERVLVRVMRD